MTDGMKTSEFWITALVTGVAFLVSIGVIDPSASDSVTEGGTEIIQAAFAMVTAIAPGLYALSRGTAKSNS